MMQEQKRDMENAAVQPTPCVNGTTPRTFSKPHALIKGWSRRTKALTALALVCFFWGTTWIASRKGVQYMPALQLAGIRQMLGGLCYVAYFVARGATWPRG